MATNGKSQHHAITKATPSVASADSQNGLQFFSFESNQVRVITINNEPWFVAVDVANILGFADSNKMTRLLDDDEKQTRHNMAGLTESRNTNVPLINEPGLYSAILKSRKPEARVFKRWVTHFVLPSIRKTGSYTLAPHQPPSTLALPDFTNPAEAARAWAAQYEEKEKLALELKEAAPKLEHYEAVMNSKGLLTVAKVGKMLGIGSKTFFAWLRLEGVLLLDNTPRQTYIKCGYLTVKETYRTDRDGEPQLHLQPMFSQKGAEWITKRYTENEGV